MSNRALIGSGVIAMLIGCRTTGHPGPSRTEAQSSLDEAAASGASPPTGDGFVAGPQDAATGDIVCPPGTVEGCTDPYNCTCGNGTGVYAAEGGFAGITVRMVGEGFTEQMILITHFINNDSGRNGPNVTFAYGYFVPVTNQWKSLGIGQVDTADYDKQSGLTVISVREIDTVPTWVLRTPRAQLLVTGRQLLALKLHLSFKVPSGGTSVQKTVTLDFNATSTNGVPPPTGNVTQRVTKYNMQWTNPDYPTPSQQYCHGPGKQPNDMLVFQQGIDVDPWTGKVSRLNAANVVTVSCSLGAPAMVYSWGYPYQGSDMDPDTFYFDAGIHMKRASYCGDSRYYTVAGTTINIFDSKPAHLSSIPSVVEAWWDRSGAVCANSEHMRHPEMAPTDPVLLSCNGKPYNGPPQPLQNCSFICEGKTLPPCPPNPPPPPFLIDGP